MTITETPARTRLTPKFVDDANWAYYCRRWAEIDRLWTSIDGEDLAVIAAMRVSAREALRAEMRHVTSLGPTKRMIPV